MARNWPSGEKERQEMGLGFTFLLLLGFEAPKLEEGSARDMGARPASGLILALAMGWFIH